MKAWLLHLLAVTASLVYHYRFDNNYDTTVEDLTGGGNHAIKPASGTSSAVNTPYGLYLNSNSVQLPPNTANASFTYSSTFTFTIFFRFISGAEDLTNFVFVFKSASGEAHYISPLFTISKFIIQSTINEEASSAGSTQTFSPKGKR